MGWIKAGDGVYINTNVIESVEVSERPKIVQVEGDARPTGKKEKVLKIKLITGREINISGTLADEVYAEIFAERL